MAETQKQPDPMHARYRNGMAHRLERIEARRGGHQGRALHQVDATTADGAADGQANGQGDQTMIRRTVERCRAERQRNGPQHGCAPVRLFGWTIAREKTEQKALQPVDNRGGWFSLIRESVRRCVAA